VVQPDRSCRVDVDTDQKFLLPSSQNNATSTDALICGSGDRPWQLEAPSGQRINISLLDFSAGSSSSSRCVRQFGFIDDKSANRHIDICSDDAHRLQTLYVSHTNEVAIVLHNTQHNTGNLLISIKGSTCRSFSRYSLLVYELCLYDNSVNGHNFIRI